MYFFNAKDLKDDEIYLSLNGTYEADAEKGWVPFYSFDICLIDGIKIGYCNFRIDNSKITEYCGNIGYGINEQFRGKRYSLKASKLLLKLAKKHKLKYVLISCEPNNYASNKICQLMNACFVKTVDIPKYHNMYKESKRTMNIYRINLDDGIQ